MQPPQDSYKNEDIHQKSYESEPLEAVSEICTFEQLLGQFRASLKVENP